MWSDRSWAWPAPANPGDHPHGDRNDDGTLVCSRSVGRRAHARDAPRDPAMNHARTSATTSGTALLRHGVKPHGRFVSPWKVRTSGAGRWSEKRRSGIVRMRGSIGQRIAAGMCWRGTNLTRGARPTSRLAGLATHGKRGGGATAGPVVQRSSDPGSCP